MTLPKRSDRMAVSLESEVELTYKLASKWDGYLKYPMHRPPNACDIEDGWLDYGEWYYLRGEISWTGMQFLLFA